MRRATLKSLGWVAALVAISVGGVALTGSTDVEAQTKKPKAAKPAPKGKKGQKGQPEEKTEGTEKTDEETKAGSTTKTETKDEPSSASKGAGTETVKKAGSGDKTNVIETKEQGDSGVKTYKFGAVEVEGRLKSPQVVYFMRRVRAEFAAGALGHRSFLRELGDTRRNSAFK
jgi:hypothetical protein